MTTVELSGDQTLRLRIHHQRLDSEPGEPGAGAAQVVAAVCGIQAQDLNAARLSIFTRSPRLSLEGIERARLEDRSIVRTWGPRGTLHLLPAADLGWMLALFGLPAITAETARQKELGLVADTLRRGVEVIVQALEQGPQERAALRQALAEAGLPYEGQATIHQIAQAGREGRLCYGGELGREPAFVLVDDWLGPLPPALEGEAALEELARRYLRAYAPAGERDLAAWSGIGLRAARRALELLDGETAQVEAAGVPAWIYPEQLDWLYAAERDSSTAPSLRLLPAFDTYLLGYASRVLPLEPQYAKKVNKGGGWILPTLLADGRVVGTWSGKKRGRRFEIGLEPFEELPKEALEAFADLGEAVQRFLGYNPDWAGR